MKRLFNYILLVLIGLTLNSCYKRPCDAYSYQEKNEISETFSGS